MDESAQRIVDGLFKAMKAEHEGYYFYKSAAANTADPQGKEVFEALADEEQDHLAFLKAHYESFKETGKLDSSASLGTGIDLSGESPIFSADIKSRIADAHYEMSALSIGIRLEQSSVAFYEAEAEAVNDSGMKAFYKDLAQWEQNHLDALVHQEDTLKEEYWYEAGFAPF